MNAPGAVAELPPVMETPEHSQAQASLMESVAPPEIPLIVQPDRAVGTGGVYRSVNAGATEVGTADTLDLSQTAETREAVILPRALGHVATRGVAMLNIENYAEEFRYQAGLFYGQHQREQERYFNSQVPIGKEKKANDEDDDLLGAFLGRRTKQLKVKPAHANRLFQNLN
jgi:hypothetical protein